MIDICCFGGNVTRAERVKSLGPEGRKLLAEIEQAERELKAVEAGIPGGASSLDPALYNPVFNLASLYDAVGWFEKELPLQQRCVRIVEKDLGDGHLHTSQAHLNLGCCYRELGSKEEEAERHIRKCLDIRIKEVGKDHDLTKHAQEVYDLGPKRRRGILASAPSRRWGRTKI